MKRREGVFLFVLIDALGAEVVQAHGFLDDLLPVRARLKTVLGYSSAALPSLLTGCLPNEHGIWSYFYLAPEASPFRWTSALAPLPERLRESRVTRKMVRAIARRLGSFDGYFNTYQVPVEYLPLFGYSAPQDPFRPGSLPRPSIFDYLQEAGVAADILTWPLSDGESLQRARASLREGRIRWYFLYLTGLDATLHRYGTRAQETERRLRWYEAQLNELYREARQRFDPVHLAVLSDHGMLDTRGSVDLRGRIEALGFRCPDDYVAVYDSTMARFWFTSPGARRTIADHLEGLSWGGVLSEHECRQLGVYWEDGRYGELIFLMEPGLLIVPSYMSRHPVAGMHGYHPQVPGCDGVFLANWEAVPRPQSILDLHAVMVNTISQVTACSRVAVKGHCNQSEHACQVDCDA